MKNIILLTTAIVWCQVAFTQSSDEIKNWQEKLITAIDDEEKLEANIELSQQYFKEGNQAGKEYAEDAIELAIKLGDNKELGTAYTQMGKIISRLEGNFPEGVLYFEKALDAYQKAEYENGVMVTYNNLAINYGMKGEDEKAIEYFHLCADIASGIKDSLMSTRVHFNIGNIYMRRVNDSLAIEYYQLSETFLPVNASLDRYGKLYIAMATSYAGLYQDDLAMEYLERTREILPKVDDFYDKHLMLSQVANVYVGIGYADKALPFAEESYQGFSSMEHVEGIMVATMILSEIYNALEMNDDFLEVIHQGLQLAKSTQSTYKQIDFYGKLSNFYFKLDSASLGVDYLLKQHHIEDSLFSLEKEEIIADIRTKYETEKKEKELIAKDHHLKMLEKEKKINQQKWFLYVTLGGFASLFMFLIINRSRVKHKKEKLLTEKQLQEKGLELKRFSEQLINKSNLIEELTVRLEENEKLDQKEKEAKIREASTLKILTEEDWIYFKNLFAEIHLSYTKLIDQIDPKLSEAEKRLLMLEKLGFGQKHMANTLGVQPNTIRVTRSRLRKKLEIGTDVNIVKFVEGSTR